MVCRVFEIPDKSSSRYMTYMCECGKKWDAPAPGAPAPEGAAWLCACGRTLAVRGWIIHAVERQFKTFRQVEITRKDSASDANLSLPRCHPLQIRVGIT